MSERALPKEFVRAMTRLREDVTASFPMMPKPAYDPLGFYVTCVPDSVYPWPAAQVRLIRREFDPGFVPLFRKLVYRSQAGSVVSFVHHGVGRAGRDTFDPIIARAQLPAGWRFERPTFVERWFEHAHVKPGSIRAKNNLPRAFVPWGDWVQRWSAETYWAATGAEKREYVEEHGDAARTASERAHAAAEAAYIQKNELPYQKKQYEELEPGDAEYVRELTAGRVKPETKPFVHLTGAEK